MFQESQPTTDPAELAKLSVKCPPFWTPDPELWFARVESQFHMAGITQESTKFHAVLACLDFPILQGVADVVRGPPPGKEYSTLKSRLLNKYKESEQSRYRRLAQERELGDRKPSELLFSMKETAGTECLDSPLLKAMWLERLPRSVQGILACQEGSVEELARLADRVHEAHREPEVYAVAATSSAASRQSSEVAELRSEMKAELAALAELVRQSDRKGHSRSKPRGRSPSRERVNGMCWFHHTFGSKARRCSKPCSYRSSEN